MPVPSLVFRVLVASPSDCAAERVAVREVVTEWNAIYSLSERVIIEPVFWESHARPALGARPQEIINEQLVADCDLAIGTFWTRLGTPTGKAESGTVEEIDEMLRNKKRVLLYFSAMPIQPDSVDPDEYARLVAYRTKMQSIGLYFRYSDLPEFRKLVQRHLSQEITALVLAYRKANGGESHGEPRDATMASRHVEDAFISGIGRLASAWRDERDSEPMRLDEGKLILAEMADEGAQLRGSLNDSDAELTKTIEDANRSARGLQKHQLFLDGGKSFDAFWKAGNETVATFVRVASQIGRRGDKQGD
jgi:hypothetical protein